jgi:hypothetical protein
MRKLIAGMRTTVDGKIDGPEGYADWVPDWSDGYGLMPHVDACLLGGGNYPGYEGYWTAIQNGPDQRHPMTGTVPTPAELEWARFAARTPHYVLSNTLDAAAWPYTRFLRKVDEVEALKHQPGKDIYLVGGARITASLIDAGLVDELRLIVYPLMAGAGKALFDTNERRRGLELRSAEQLADGRMSLVYGIN